MEIFVQDSPVVAAPPLLFQDCIDAAVNEKHRIAVSVFMESIQGVRRKGGTVIAVPDLAEVVVCAQNSNNHAVSDGSGARLICMDFPVIGDAIPHSLMLVLV